MDKCPERPNLLKITLEEKSDDVSIAVCDNGTGFPQSVLARDGNMWSSTKAGDGHGIGLNTCQTLLRRMNGIFQVSNNTAPQNGATVTLVFKNINTHEEEKSSPYSV
jgi:C4-dicarboxylate-specific signal transduction histidine kinase